MTALEFRTAAQADQSIDDLIEVNIADARGGNIETYEALVPTEDQVIIYMSYFDESTVVRLGATRKFMRDVFGEDDANYLLERVADRNDPLDFDTVTQILRGIVEEATARPTRPSTGSTASRRPGGRPLTDHLPPKAQTRSSSRRVASATSSTPGAPSESKTPRK